jgi:uncharacterized protein (TIGR04222 family)
LAEHLRFDLNVIVALDLWLVGGWWFVVVFVALVAASWARAIRERRLAVARADGDDARELDQYELAMLDANSEGHAVLLAVVNLVRRGVLQPGPQWAAKPSSGEPVFSLVVGCDLGSDAHPLERDVFDAVRSGLSAESAESLLRQLAKCDAITRIRSRLVAAGLMYPEQRGLLRFGAWYILFMLPTVALLAAAALRIGGDSNTDGGVSFCAVIVGTYLVYAVPDTRAATPLGSAAVAVGKQRQPAEAEHNKQHQPDAAQELVTAFERRFVGL